MSVCPLATVPDPPSATNMEIPSPPSDDVAIGDKVGFKCKSNHWFENQDTRSNDSFELTCPPDGIYLVVDWPNCVPDINCPIPLAADPFNKMALTDTSVTTYGYNSKAK